ncbi:MAG TPA: hypothetical protein DCO72_00205 [Ruminococcus sp.]|nr:hypothetical protein [Ruminococcus sp.]
MKLMRRNLRSVWYQLYQGQTAQTDADGFETGEITVSYGAPVKMLCSVSPASGNILAETFGTLAEYDKIIVTDDIACPIDENSVLYVDTDVNGEYDYVVKRVAKSLNFIAYAVSKVENT